MTIDWTTVIVAAVTGLLSGAAITAVWQGLRARAESRRSDSMAHVEAADALAEISAEQIQRTDARLATLEEKCRRYEMGFDAMHLELIQARKTIARLEIANADLRNRVKHLENENADLHRRLNAVNQRMENGGKHD